MNAYIQPNPDDVEDSIFGTAVTHNAPLPPTIEGADTIYEPLDSPVVSANHVHEWTEVDEGHPDGHMTAQCSGCGYGITYYPSVHGVQDGKLVNK